MTGQILLTWALKRRGKTIGDAAPYAARSIEIGPAPVPPIRSPKAHASAVHLTVAMGRTINLRRRDRAFLYVDVVVRVPMQQPSSRFDLVFDAAVSLARDEINDFLDTGAWT